MRARSSAHFMQGVSCKGRRGGVARRHLRFPGESPGRAAPTGLIVDAFSHRVKDKGMFRRLLKQAARLEKGAGTAQWVLRDEFA